MQHLTATTNQKRGLVMVLDDDLNVRESLADALGDQGFETVAFEAGQEGLAWLDAHAGETTLMLVDLMMPAMRGDEFLAAKEKRPNAANVPVILMTASGRDVYEPVVRRHSIFRCLTKPLALDSLLAAIKACVGQKAGQPSRVAASLR